MIILCSAIRQIRPERGYHATFMCRPLLPNVCSSGWHLHESLPDAKAGRNAFQGGKGEVLSEAGGKFAAGILQHAVPMTGFSTPTINGYKRFWPYSFARDRDNLAMENRGAMLRVQGQPGGPGSTWRTGWASRLPIPTSTWRPT